MALSKRLGIIFIYLDLNYQSSVNNMLVPDLETLERLSDSTVSLKLLLNLLKSLRVVDKRLLLVPKVLGIGT